MKNTYSWSVECAEGECCVSYLGNTFDGKLKLIIDGESQNLSPTLVKGVGLIVVFKRSDRVFVLKTSPNYKDADLIVDGVSQSGRYYENLDFTALRQQLAENNSRILTLQRNVKSGMSSYLTVIILTIINNFLFMIDASVSFPFSLFFPSVFVVFGRELSYEFGNSIYAIGFVIAMLIIAVYAIFYYLSSKYVFAIWVAVVMVVLDTLILFGFAFLDGDVASYLIDFAFHAWIIWAIVKLATSKNKLDETTKAMLTHGENN